VSAPKAIGALSGKAYSLPSADKILLGREYRYATWVVEGYREVIERKSTPASTKVQMLGSILGWETTARLLRLRDHFARGPLKYLRDVLREDYEDAICKEFCAGTSRRAFPSDGFSSLESKGRFYDDGNRGCFYFWCYSTRTLAAQEIGVRKEELYLISTKSNMYRRSVEWQLVGRYLRLG
jgi:hypothetical protein